MMKAVGSVKRTLQHEAAGENIDRKYLIDVLGEAEEHLTKGQAYLDQIGRLVAKPDG